MAKSKRTKKTAVPDELISVNQLVKTLRKTSTLHMRESRQFAREGAYACAARSQETAAAFDRLAELLLRTTHAITQIDCQEVVDRLADLYPYSR